MTRKRNFKCPICKVPRYKKELYSRSLVFTDIVDGIKCTRTFKHKGICSNKECYNKWRDEIYEKYNQN